MVQSCTDSCTIHMRTDLALNTRDFQASSRPHTKHIRPISNVVLLPCLAGSTVARLQHDTSTTWFQTSNLIQSNRTAVAENKTQ